MKSNANLWWKCRAALVRRWDRLTGRPAVAELTPGGVADEAPTPRLNPLERITEYLRRRGLGQQVRVHFEATSRDFVLEDADGIVHAKDYDQAVVLIERIWLYQQ